MHKIFLVILSFLFTTSLLSQHIYDEGFTYLENQQYKKAEEFFKNELALRPSNKTALICHARAVGLGGNYMTALQLMKDLKSDFPKDYEVGLNYGEALMWSQRFEEAYVVYEELLNIDSTNFVANYGFANANSALENYEKAIDYNQRAIVIDSTNESAKNARKYILLGNAYKLMQQREFTQSEMWIDTVQKYYPDNPNAIEILNQINSKKSSHIALNYYRSGDGIGNEAQGVVLSSQAYVSPKFDALISLHDRTAKLKGTLSNTNQRIFDIGGIYHASKKIDIKAGIGLNAINDKFENVKNNNLISNLSFRYQIGPRQFAELKYNREAYNYSVPILSEQILLNHYSFVHHISFPVSIGNYSNVILTDQTDGNRRLLIFNSAYYDFGTHSLKMGINYTLIRNKFRRDELYYSPLSFRSVETFLMLENSSLKQKFQYNINGAIGFQKDGNSENLLTKRIEIAAKYPVTSHLVLGVKCLAGNITEGFNSGSYTFNQVGITLVYKL